MRTKLLGRHRQILSDQPAMSPRKKRLNECPLCLDRTQLCRIVSMEALLL